MPLLTGGDPSRSFLLTPGCKNRDVLPQRNSHSTGRLSPGARSVNISIGGSDRAPKIPFKKPLKTKSFTLPRARSSDSSPVLPDRAPEALSAQEDSPYQRRCRSRAKSFRAAEGGKGDLLPKTRKTRAPARTGSTPIPNRVRASSSDDLPLWYKSAPEEQLKAFSQSLRSRRRTIHVEEDLSSLDENGKRVHHQSVALAKEYWGKESPIAEDSCHGNNGCFHDRYRKSAVSAADDLLNNHKFFDAVPPPLDFISLSKIIMSLKLGHLLQMAIVAAVLFLVWDSYNKAIETTEQLLQFKHDESMLMLHLQRVEQHSINLHEHLDRLNEQTLATGRNHHSATNDQQDNISADHKKAPVQVDLELIRKQTQQLREMEQEINHEVRGLQSNIQRTARSSIVRTYGEGPVQVVLDVSFPGAEEQKQHSEQHHIGILLWYDTPHAAWTWLEQISRGDWDGSEMELDEKGVTFGAIPATLDRGSRLDFVEHSVKSHEPWTVGLMDFVDGGFGMFINLQDNTGTHKHRVCVGKVIDGFDVLQQVVDLTRKRESSNDQAVTIKSATASHLTRRETAGLI